MKLKTILLIILILQLGITNSAPAICLVTIDIDYTFYKKYYQHSRELIHESIDKAFQTINNQMAPLIEIKVEKINLLNQYTRVTGGLENLLHHYQVHVSQVHRNETSIKNCLNMLIVHRPYASLTAFGIAYLGLGSPLCGGICSTYNSLRDKYLNLISINMILYNPAILTRITIHEVGHSLGAPHDCCANHECDEYYNLETNCLNPKKPFVMNEFVTRSDNSLIFSPKSKQTIEWIVPLQSNCLVES